MSERSAETGASRLSESQVLALADVEDGVETFVHPRTLSSLRERGLVVRTSTYWELTPAGRMALDAARRRWPALLRKPPAKGGAS